MATTQEYNQFRRLIGDAKKQEVSTAEMDSYLNDAVLELTGDFATPLTSFEVLVQQYHNEAIYKAAINWWWNLLSELQDKHSISVGGNAQTVSEKWDRAFQMIQQLQAYYDDIQALKVDITMGNLSRYSKQTLRRIGGEREEDVA